MCADHLFLVSRSNIFSIYPKILKEITITEELLRLRESLTSSLCFLPSDFEWQMRMYFRLLEQQKLINAAVERGEVYQDISFKQNKVLWESIDLTLSASTSASTTPDQQIDDVDVKKRKRCISYDMLSYCSSDENNIWDLYDYANAGKLLMKPPLVVNFIDEYEMRKVYSLIYDVYRYKLLLNQALNDISIFSHHPKLITDKPRVWLLMFELYCRKFNKRNPEATKTKDKLFVEPKLLDIEAILWSCKTKLAASMTRLRIQSNALVISELLPKHLQDNKVALAVSCPILTGYVNNFKQKITKKETVAILSDMGYSALDDANEKLRVNHYKWDKICPQFLTVYPNNRRDFVNSSIMKNSEFIIQDRGFAVGPAMFAKLLDILDLRGDVLQTHIFSPRSTAYLASLFMNSDRVNRFIVFGAGNKLEELKKYMSILGVTNISFMVEDFTELTPTSSVLLKAVGIFATPPSSYSGISDPIDLICSRGGDLSMLELLSESEMTVDGQKRVSQLLTEQRETLKLAMCRSYTQFVLYETHSIVDSENEDMVQSTIEFMNRKARDKHVRTAKEKEKEKEKDYGGAAVDISTSQPENTKSKKALWEDSVSKLNKRSAIDPDSTLEADSSESETEPLKLKLLKKSPNVITEEDYARIKTPDTDLFATTPLPDLCHNRDRCLNLAAQGCYVALIRRKEIVRLDSKYLIKMAEVRGIFGGTDKSKKSKSSNQKRLEKKAEEMKLAAAQQNNGIVRSNSSLQELIVRLNAPTQASYKRGHLHRMSSATKQFIMVDLTNAAYCPRHLRRHHVKYTEDSVVTCMQLLNETEAKKTIVKGWWKQACQHIAKLKAMRSRPEYDLMEQAKTCPLVLERNKQLKNRFRRNQKEVYTVPVRNVEFRDYLAANNVLSFPPIQQGKTLRHPIINTEQDEPK